MFGLTKSVTYGTAFFYLVLSTLALFGGTASGAGLAVIWHSAWLLVSIALTAYTGFVLYLVQNGKLKAAASDQSVGGIVVTQYAYVIATLAFVGFRTFSHLLYNTAASGVQGYWHTGMFVLGAAVAVLYGIDLFRLRHPVAVAAE